MANFNDFISNCEEQKNSEAFGLLKNFAKKYEGISESEMIKAIVAEAEKNRAEGKLTDKDLDGFADMLSPMLTPQQAKRLEKIIRKLKKK